MQQKIYNKDFHGIEIHQIDKEALYVLEKLTAAGHIAYLVGGGVRDLLLGKRPKDYDISTSAEPEVVRRLFRNCILIGKRFRLAHIRFGKKIIEVSTFRSGDTENDALITRDNEWGSPEEDVLRRDFTINGLFYDPIHETVIDYVNGFADIEKRCLRTIGQPFVRFKQDPVRMLRLLKFQARFGFSVDPEAQTALIENRSEIIKSSSSRVLEEFLRMLESGSSKNFLKLLVDYNFLPLILPSIADFLEQEEGSQIYPFLEEIDNKIHNNEPVDRSLTLASLLFPLFQKRLNALFATREKPPHLGEIQEEAFQLFEDTFNSFLRVPHRMKIATTSILIMQFRFTPFDKKKPRSLRLPNDPYTDLALHFFSMRAHLDPTLKSGLQSWLKSKHPETAESAPQPRKRRSRRRRGPKKSAD